MGNITNKLKAGVLPAGKYITELSKATMRKLEWPKRSRVKKSRIAATFVYSLAASNSENDSSKYAVH
ncbi:MAG: hypothetical protein CMM76_00270 [Rhodospirillaceae bacterium]|nr:hypothetical protein [Rhodospirillaceae bacterium]